MNVTLQQMQKDYEYRRELVLNRKKQCDRDIQTLGFQRMVRATKGLKQNEKY